MISDEAVEAAAKALFEESVTPWRMAAKEERVIFRRRARAALEAAAPHLMAESWDQGYDEGLSAGRGSRSDANPYRSQG